MGKYDDIIEKSCLEHIEVIKDFLENNHKDIETIIDLFIKTFKNGGKIVSFGNGGCSSDSSHLTSELVGRYSKNRISLPAISLNDNSSSITCIGNDYSFDDIFSRQITSLCSDKDLVIGFSTSGTSTNVIEAVKAAKKIGCKIVSFSGVKDNMLFNISDFNVCANLWLLSNRNI